MSTPYAPDKLCNENILVATLTAIAASGNSPDMDNMKWRGVTIGINVSAHTGTAPTLTVTLQGKDDASGTYYTILASTALAATGFTRLTVFPGATASANAFANDILPKTWRVAWALGGSATPTITGTIGAAVEL